MPYPKWRRRHSSRARVILRPGRPHEPNDRGPLPVPLCGLPVASSRVGRGLAGPESPAPLASRSARELPAGRPAARDHPRRGPARQSGHPGRDVLRSHDPRTRDGPGLRGGHRQVDHDPGAAGPSAAQSRPDEHRRRAGSRQLQRLSESRPRAVSRLRGVAAPPGPADRERRRGDDRRLREARARARSPRRARRVQHLFAQHAARVRVEPEARRARDVAPGGSARDREAAHRQALTRFRRDERARDHPGGTRRRDPHRQLRQHA